jgi:hypothetical protein
MPLPKGKVAFVSGANGISGNALVEQLIRKPENEWYGHDPHPLYKCRRCTYRIMLSGSDYLMF